MTLFPWDIRVTFTIITFNYIEVMSAASLVLKQLAPSMCVMILHTGRGHPGDKPYTKHNDRYAFLEKPSVTVGILQR